MTPIEYRKYVAERQEAGTRLDPEVTTVFSKYVLVVDPYGICGDIPPEYQVIGRERFVFSPQTGEILVDDLTDEVREKLGISTQLFDPSNLGDDIPF